MINYLQENDNSSQTCSYTVRCVANDNLFTLNKPLTVNKNMHTLTDGCNINRNHLAHRFISQTRNSE